MTLTAVHVTATEGAKHGAATHTIVHGVPEHSQDVTMYHDTHPQGRLINRNSVEIMHGFGWTLKPK